MATPLDHSKPYPWPKIPTRKTVNVMDILDDLKASIAAKPARDAAARRAAGARTPFSRTTAPIEGDTAAATEQKPAAKVEAKKGA
jgi:hypothetical protein